MTFKRFTETGFRLGKSGKPMVSIWRQGQISFNTAAMQAYKLKEYNYAVLYYDEDAKAVGIMLTNDGKEDGAIKLIKRTSGGFSVSGKRFLHFHKISYEKTASYPVEWDDESKLYVFKLEQQP
jgi:hypothetical protein